MKDKREIDYEDIKSLGFETEKVKDELFYNQNGYHYKIVTLRLTKSVFVDWDIETRMCELQRRSKHGTILGRMIVHNLDHLKEIIDFYDDEKEMFR